MPVAVNCWFVPLAIDGVAGVTEMDMRTGGAVTVSVVMPLMEPLVAEMTVVPIATAVATPAEEIVAVAVVAEAQVTVGETSFVVPSLKVPVAENCCVPPVPIDGLLGATAIETSVAVGVGVGAVTVSVVVPLTVPLVAVMTVEPMATAVARPPEAIVAVLVVAEVHVAVADRSFVDWSL